MKPVGPFDTRPLYWCGNEPIDENALLDGVTKEEAKQSILRQINASRSQTEAQHQNMSGPMALRIPRLLEMRRQEWNIPDQVFYYVGSFDWVSLYQLPPVTGQAVMAGSGLLVKPQMTQDIELRTASRGIIITAGLTALDILFDHGHFLGNIVRFTRLGPWYQTIGKIGSKEFELITIKPGDICSNEDHWPMLQNGDMKLVAEPDERGQIRHRYKMADGNVIRGDAAPQNVGDY